MAPKSPKKVAPKRPESIHTSARSIICHEVSINLSDEKLRRMLSTVYEKARSDERKPNIHQHYGVFYSAALTLLLTQLTADFKAIGIISAEKVTIGCWGLIGLLALLGFILMLLHYAKRGESDIHDRDKSIETAMDEIMTVNNENNGNAA